MSTGIDRHTPLTFTVTMSKDVDRATIVSAVLPALYRANAGVVTVTFPDGDTNDCDALSLCEHGRPGCRHTTEVTPMQWQDGGWVCGPCAADLRAEDDENWRWARLATGGN